MEIIDRSVAFFGRVAVDIKCIVDDSDPYEGQLKERIIAVTLKIFGAIGLLFAAVATFSLVTTFILQPLTNALLLFLFVPLLPLSYDHMTIGQNMVEKIERDGEDNDEEKEKLYSCWWRETLLYGPIHRLIHKEEGEESLSTQE